MEKTDFDRLMERYLKGQVTEQEKNKIEAWLNVMKMDDTTNLELSKVEEDKLFAKITSNLDNVDEILSIRPARSRPNPSKWILGIAASLALFFLITFTVWTVTNKRNVGNPGVATNKVEKVILPDGSIVWLRANARLTYSEDNRDGTRHSELNGEALFEIAKDPTRPFTVKCGAVMITVVGTSFNIKMRPNQVELEVLTGRVKVNSDQLKENLTVIPNERIILNSNGQVERVSMVAAEKEKAIANTDYEMTFNDSHMSEILQRIEKKFNVTVSVDRKEIGNCRITADFTDHSLEASLEMIAEVLNVKVSKKGNEIIISGQGCQ